jgi:hypothetical protein
MECLMCKKNVPNRRRTMACDVWSETMRECCSDKCWQACIRESNADMAKEAAYDLEAEMQGERNADCAFHMAHGE